MHHKILTFCYEWRPIYLFDWWNSTDFWDIKCANQKRTILSILLCMQIDWAGVECAIVSQYHTHKSTETYETNNFRSFGFHFHCRIFATGFINVSPYHVVSAILPVPFLSPIQSQFTANMKSHVLAITNKPINKQQQQQEKEQRQQEQQSKFSVMRLNECDCVVCRVPRITCMRLYVFVFIRLFGSIVLPIFFTAST